MSTDGTIEIVIACAGMEKSGEEDGLAETKKTTTTSDSFLHAAIPGASAAMAKSGTRGVSPGDRTETKKGDDSNLDHARAPETNVTTIDDIAATRVVTSNVKKAGVMIAGAGHARRMRGAASVERETSPRVELEVLRQSYQKGILSRWRSTRSRSLHIMTSCNALRTSSPRLFLERPRWRDPYRLRDRIPS